MHIILSIPAALALAACSTDNVPVPDPPVMNEAAPATPPAPSEGSAQQAGQIVQRYYALLEAGRYADAYALWEPAAAGMTPQQFADSFARYTEHGADVGTPGRVDAGAGQRYVTVPVKTHGTLKTGTPFATTGVVVLHRTADIDGATAAQRQWHIRSIDLKPDAAPAAAPATVTARYRCIDGSRLVAVFDNRRDIVTLRRGKETLGVLAGQRPASGIWYKGDGLELRGKGVEATFTQPNLPPMACRSEG